MAASTNLAGITHTPRGGSTCLVFTRTGVMAGQTLDGLQKISAGSRAFGLSRILGGRRDPTHHLIGFSSPLCTMIPWVCKFHVNIGFVCFTRKPGRK